MSCVPQTSGIWAGTRYLRVECFSLPWTREQLEHQINGSGSLLLVACCGGEPAGYMGLDFVLDEGYVTNVCTAPAFRRRGVASALIDGVTARGRELGLSFITLEARVSNAAARSLYAGKALLKPASARATTSARKRTPSL